MRVRMFFVVRRRCALFFWSLKSGRRPLVTGKSFMIGGIWFEHYSNCSSNNNAIQQCIVWACGASIVTSRRIRRPNDIRKSARIRRPDETEKNYLPMPFKIEQPKNQTSSATYASSQHDSWIHEDRYPKKSNIIRYICQLPAVFVETWRSIPWMSTPLFASLSVCPKETPKDK